MTVTNPEALNATLHYTIIRHILDRGYAPDTQELSRLLDLPEETAVSALKRLAEDHGVVLHPDEPKIWAIHPFSLAPTQFWVRSGDRAWWGNCGWCSLGIAALVEGDVTISTSFGAEGRPVDLHVCSGRMVEGQYLIHFPVPMRKCWDNVVYACSNMLIFENEAAVDAWCLRHRMPKGDIQPLSRFWEFAKEWYGKHLDPHWRKWTSEEASALFQRHGLGGDTWEISASRERF
jgi:hypothetical protein